VSVTDLSRPVSERSAAAYRAGQLANSREPDQLRPYLEAMPMPKRTPSYGDVMLDHAGGIWRARHPLPEDQTVEYHGIDAATTRPIGTITLPTGWTLMDMNRSHLYARVETEEGIQAIAIAPRVCQ
jgi:hypothetical protein